MPPRTKPSSSEWDHHKITIRNLYLGQDLKLKEVQAQLGDLGFVASKSQYEAKFKEWGFSKNIPVNTWKHVGHKIEKRKREGKDSVICINGVEIPAKRVKKETSRHFYSVAQRLEIERNNAPSPPDLSVATPANTEEIFLLDDEPTNFLWSTFTRVLDIQLTQIHRNLQIFRSKSSSMQEIIQNNHLFPGHDHGASHSGGWRILFDHIDFAHSGLIHSVLPLSFDIEHPAEIQQDMCLVSTFSSHWGLQMLIYLASNKLLDTYNIGGLWRMIKETGIGQLANVSRSPHMKDLSLAAALEYLFEAGIARENTDVVSWVLDTGMDPNNRVKLPNVVGTHLPLIAAMYPETETFRPRAPNVKILRLLLESGASSVLSCCEHHRCPIQFVIWTYTYHKNLEILDMFLEVAETLNDSPKSRSIQYSDPSYTFWGIELENDAFDQMNHLVDLIEDFAADAPYPSARLITPESLIRAVENDNRTLIKIIHKHGLTMDCYDVDGRFPLQAAAQSSYIEDGYMFGMDRLVNLLLELGASPNYNPKSYATAHCSPALHAAIHSSSLSDRKLRAIGTLCEQGALVQGCLTCGKCGHYTLMDCALSQQECRPDHLIRLILILHDAGLPLSEKSLLAAFEVAHNGSKRELDGSESWFMSLLRIVPEDSLKLCPQSKRGWTALDYAVSLNMQRLQKPLLEKGINHTLKFAFEYCLVQDCSIKEIGEVMARVRTRTPRNTRQAQALLIHQLIGTLRAIDLGDQDFESVTKLLHDYRITPRTAKQDAYVLYKVCRTGDTRFVTRALQLLRKNYNSAALWFLMREYQWGSVNKLLLHGLGTFADFSQGTWILTWAVRRALEAEEDTKVLEWFNEHDRTPLERAILHASTFSIKFFGIDGNANLCENANIAQWFTCGLKASSYLGLLLIGTGNVEKVSALLEQGFNPNRRIAWSFTALQFAVALADRPMTLRLLQAGCDVNARPPWRDIPHYILAKVPDVVRSVLTFHDQYTHRRNALQLAVEKGDLPMTKLLLDCGADVNYPPSRIGGATALQIACIEGHIEIVTLLVSTGADINASGAEYFGRTALEGAAEHGRLDITRLLLEHDCRVDGSSRRQYIRAVGFSRAEGHHVLSKMLQSLGKWKKEDENVLKQTDLRDKEPISRDLEEDLDDEEEISEVDPEEFKSDDDGAHPLDTNNESILLDCDSASADEDATPSPNYVTQETKSNSGRREQFAEPSSTPRPKWVELVEHCGNDEQDAI